MKEKRQILYHEGTSLQSVWHLIARIQVLEGDLVARQGAWLALREVKTLVYQGPLPGLLLTRKRSVSQRLCNVFLAVHECDIDKSPYV